MAQRGEGQGLQIAVISFAILAIVLAGMSYFFFSSAQTAQKDLESKNKSLTERQQQIDKLMYKVAAMNYVLGLKGVAPADLEVAKGKAGGDDPDVKELLDNFNNDVALVGTQVAPEGPQSYRTITTSLLATINQKNSSVANAIDASRTASAARDKATVDEKTRADTAVAAADKAVNDYKQESDSFAAARAKMEEEKVTLVSQNTTLSSKSKGDIQRVIDEKEVLAKQNGTLIATNRRLMGELEQYRDKQTGLREQPDGHVVRVDQRLRLVWIDVGRADGLLRQTSFAIFDNEESGSTNKKPKARIEVVNVVGDHMSEARILEDTPANPIIGGDIINTPAWSPGQRIHFALAMKMDINKDGIDDYDLVKSIIQMNGGMIDAELRPDGTREGNIDVNTRYFVEGERPNEGTSPEVQKKYNAFANDRDAFNVPKISVDRLLALMGWRAEERTVELAGNRGGAFGAPMPKKPAQPAGDATAPATESAAPAAADPFGAPAPATPTAPAPGDPFAPAAADPFAPK